LREPDREAVRTASSDTRPSDSRRPAIGEPRAGQRSPVTGHSFSLYLHVPYCQSKCPYCDFNSYAATRWPEEEYTAALIAELEHCATSAPWSGRRIDTIFFGGGTPSLFAPESIARILDAALRLWPACESPLTGNRWPVEGEGTDDGSLFTDHRPEVTLEANPGTVTPDKLRGFRSAGVNRMSFGVQSFHAKHLSRLGRLHGAAEAVAAVAMALRAGFTRVNADLIFALPEQTLSEWEEDLRAACSLGTDHLSVYNLTYEEGTAFHARRAQGELAELPEEIEIRMFESAQEILGAAGYRQYEISNYARPGAECRHNLNYWRAGEYLGAGAGAHSFARTPGPGRRWSNEKSPARYIQRVQSRGNARIAEETLDDRQARGEHVFLGLRCIDGIDTRAFAARFGVEFLEAFPHSESLRRDGLLTAGGSRWRLSQRGLLVADSVFATYL
jgi:oxygen-independent coproporphyrinogen-3 oxidase